LNKYELDRASRPIMDFVDDLSTWYIRRSRDRFKSEDLETRETASYYTAFVLRELSKVMAPFVPFIAEEVYRRVGGEKESVHLEDWPKAEGINSDILLNMKVVREVVSKALEMRQKAGHKVRQPLSLLSIPNSLVQEYLDIIADEVNVKKVEVGSSEIKLDTNLTEELKKEGIARDIIRGIQDVRKQENLNPNDKIKIMVNAPLSIQEIINTYLVMISTPTQIEKIDYSEAVEKYKISIEGQDISISVKK
jgi:isoleucyl-tRNA synthetase